MRNEIMNEPEFSKSTVDQQFAVFYNLENLYSVDYLITTKNGNRVPALKNWTEKRYQNKIHKIAHVFELVKEDKGQLPFLIGVSEIQGEQPLQDLLKLEPFSGNFGYVHYDSMDERGIDVALLYDRNEIEIISSEPISFFFEIVDENPENYDTTRDVLYCKFKYRGELLHTFVLHLPSKRDQDINLPKRKYILNEIKERIVGLTKEQGGAVMILGDFNDNPNSENVQNFLNVPDSQTRLFNPFSQVYQDRIFSNFHSKFGLLFDQIIISKEFFDGVFPLQFRKAEVFKPMKIMDWDKRFHGRPFRTYAGTRYIGGYSDHFPVIMSLENIKR